MRHFGDFLFICKTSAKKIAQNRVHFEIQKTVNANCIAMFHLQNLKLLPEVYISKLNEKYTKTFLNALEVSNCVTNKKKSV